LQVHDLLLVLVCMLGWSVHDARAQNPFNESVSAQEEMKRPATVAEPAITPVPDAPSLPPGALPPPVPSGADVHVLPIDLPSALRLVNTTNPTIALARARVREAYAHLREARVLWLPNLQTGPSYLRHDGLIQNALGLVFPTNKWSFFEGGGAVLSVDTSDALFAPLIARRLLEAQNAAARTVSDNIQLDVALTYLDLLRAYGALAINGESLTNAKETARLAAVAEKAGLGKTPADLNRARTEVDVREQERIDLEGQAGVVSARLAQLLLFDPTADLWPVEPAIVPIALVPADMPLDDMVAAGVMNRPELAESRALVAASLARWRKERYAPLFPRLDVGYLAGEFTGGINESTEHTGSRGDGYAQAVWTVRNFGIGNVARSQVGRAQYDQANLHVTEVQAQVAAEVSAAAKLVRSRQRSLASAQEGVRQAEEMWRSILKWTQGVGFAVKQYEAVELVLAEQALNQARVLYLSEVIEFNKAQFRLYWAMGQPPQCGIDQANEVRTDVPVLPTPGKVLPQPKEMPAPAEPLLPPGTVNNKNGNQ
jgi:outer membrane protein TolC